jgi:hypothetical protein
VTGNKEIFEKYFQKHPHKSFFIPIVRVKGREKEAPREKAVLHGG